MREVKNFPNRIWAEQARDLLEKEGVFSVICGDDIGILGTTGGAVPMGVSLRVQEEDYERASHLISALYDGI
ncbi:MAG: DUF2007 domain-containing protein [Thermodesulfobacteriota bacterium]|nr:DUF2007 domain-containing protein [Thermodesulfobacteriota bacterium]